MKKILVICYLVILALQVAFSSEYQVDGSKKNNIKFISDAPLEDFEGNTSKIDGYINLKDATNLYNAELYFEVDLNSVDTGIGLRNRHMREEYLHTDKYPITSFKGSINEVSKVNTNDYDVKVTGDITIHGVSKKITIPGKLFLENTSIHIKSNFIVKLTDFKIEVPKMMFVKISEDIKLQLDFTLKKIN